MPADLPTIGATIVTGFLGSGKTTLINKLLRSPALRDAVVIVNEFGAVSIDHHLVRGSGEIVVQLANGCLCCALRGELVDTLRSLASRRRAGELPKFERLIIETSGLAAPGPIIQTLTADPLVHTAYALEGVITVFDALNGTASLADFGESAEQLAVADRIVLNKADLLPPDGRSASLDRTCRDIRTVNPNAPIVTAQGDSIDEALVSCGTGDAHARGFRADFATAQGDGRVGHDMRAHHSAAIRTFCLTRDGPLTFDALTMFLDMVGRHCAANLLRVKGVVNLAERPEAPALVQGAGRMPCSVDWLPGWPTADRRTQLVFIVKGTPPADIEGALALAERMALRMRGTGLRPDQPPATG